MFIIFVRISEHPAVGRCHFIFESSQSHDTRCDSSGRLNIPVHRTLPHKTQHSQETHTMARRDLNQLSQQASDRRPTQHCLGNVFVLGGESWTRTDLKVLARDLYHNNQHFCCTILSHIANWCGHFELIWSVSCFSPNISHRSFLLTHSCAASF